MTRPTKRQVRAEFQGRNIIIHDVVRVERPIHGAVVVTTAEDAHYCLPLSSLLYLVEEDVPR